MAFDQGDRAEAIRIAGVVRTLLKHGNPKWKNPSRSLLTLMDARRIQLLTTVPRLNHRGLIYFSGMTRFEMGPAGPRVVPMLDTSGTRNFVSVESWWAEQPIHVEKQPLFRRDVILVAAEKDGAAHVDEDLPPEYEKLVTGEGWEFVQKHPDGSETRIPAADFHLVWLRQMGYELLHSPELLALAGETVG